VFVFLSKSGESAALVRRRSLIFAPTVAKTVAIGGPSVDGQFGACPISIGPTYKVAVWENIEWTRQKHRLPISVKEMVTEAGKEAAEALRDIAIMVAGEAAKRALWG